MSRMILATKDGRWRRRLAAAVALAAALLLAPACKTAALLEEPSEKLTSSDSGAKAASGVVDFTILQLNDIYEINPVEGGRRGGLARVATLRKKLLAENPQTLTQGQANKGSGGYLLYAGIDRAAATGGWRVKGAALEDGRIYKVLIGDFLLTGQEKGLAFLNPEFESAGLSKVRDSKDVRIALSEALQAALPKP